MSVGGLGKRYAKALLSLASESNEVDRVAKDLSDLAAAWGASRELRDIFTNPGFGPDVRKKIVAALAERANVSATLKNTLMLLSDRRRLRHLPEIAEAFAILSEERAGRVRAEVVTAGALPEAYFAELQRALESVTGKKVTVTRKQDPSLIAGVVARVGDRVFDGSLRTRLSELQEELLAQ